MRGGKQPYIIAIFVADYFSDENLKIFDEKLVKISQDIEKKEFSSLEVYHQEIVDVFALTQQNEEPIIDLNEYYSYTAAMEDFQAGVKLFQTKNFNQAYEILRKV